MAAMTDEQINELLSSRRVAVLGIGRSAAGPLLAPIWFLYHPAPRAFELLMDGTSAKARRLRAEGRASVCVQADDYPYRYVLAEGAVLLQPLGEETKEAVQAMASRYLGEAAGRRYAERFDSPDEIRVTLTPDRWQAVIV